MFTRELRRVWQRRRGLGHGRRWALLGLYLAMTVQFVSCYIFLVHPYVDLDGYAHGGLSRVSRERVGVLSAGDVDLRDFVQVRFVACAAALTAEEAVARALARSDAPSEQDERALVRAA